MWLARALVACAVMVTVVKAVVCSGTTPYSVPSSSYYTLTGFTASTVDVNCTYVFTPLIPNSRLQISLSTFDTTPFIADEVYVYDGNSTDAPQKAVWSGVNYGSSSSAVSDFSSNVATVQLRQFAGKRVNPTNVCFYVQATPLCANNSLTVISSGGYFSNQSPGFTSGFVAPRNTICQFLVQPSSTTTRPYVYVSSNYNYLAAGDVVEVIDINPVLGNTTYVMQSYPFGTQTFYASATNRSLLVTYRTGPTFRGGGYNNYASGFYMYSSSVSSNTGPCSGVAALVNSTSGTMSSQTQSSLYPYIRYPPNSYCAFPIATTPGNRIRFYSGNTYLDTYGDAVTIYDGIDATAPRIGSFFGQQSVSNIVTTGEVAYVVFTSNNNTAADLLGGSAYFGFQFYWQAAAPASYTPTLPRTAANLNGCSGVVTITGTSGTVTLGIVGNTTNGYAPNNVCGWVIVGAAGSSVQFTLTRFLGSDLLRWYSDTWANPAMYQADLTSSSTYYSMASTFYVELRTDANTASDGWGFSLSYLPYTQQSFAQMCQPSGNAAPVDGTQFGLYLSGGRYLSNLNCTWLATSGATARYYIYSNIAAGDSLTIYDGNSTSGPIVFRSTNPSYYNSFYSYSGQAYYVFTSDGSPPSANGNGFYSYYQSQNFNLQSCANGLTTLSPPLGAFSVSFPAAYLSGYRYLPADRDCAYTMTVSPGVAMSFSVTMYMLPGDKISLYDGPTTSSPALVSMSRNGYSSTLPSTFIPTACSLTVRITTRANYFGRDYDQYTGYGLNLQITTTQGLPNSGSCMVGTQPTCGGATFMTTADITSTYLACVWCTGQLYIYNSFSGNFTMPNLQIITSTGSLYYTYGSVSGDQAPYFNFPQLTAVGGAIQMQSNYMKGFYAPNLKSVSTLYFYNLYLSSFSLDFPSLTTATSVQIQSNYGLQSLNLRALQWATSVSICSNNQLPALDLGSLTTATTINLQGLDQVQMLNLSSMVVINSFQMYSNSQLMNLTLPRVTTVTNQLYFSGMSGLQNLQLPKLRTVQTLQVSSASQLKVFNVSALETVTSSVYTTSTSLNAVDFSSLISCNQLQMNNDATLVEISLPRMQRGNLYLGSMALLERILIPSAASANIQLSTGNNRISQVYAPQLTTSSINIANGNPLYAAPSFPVLVSGSITILSLDVTSLYLPVLATPSTFSLSGPRIPQVSLPSMKTVSTFLLENCQYLTSVSIPLLQQASSFTLTSTALTRVDAPSFLTVSTLAFKTNPFLSAIYMCGLSTASTVQVVSSPSLSCFETRQMFGRFTLNMPNLDCNTQLRGTYGCAANFTRTVNVTGCGYTVPCIQSAIFASYSNVSIVVAIPAGTYTDCSIPLNFLGRVMALAGDGADDTVIDCQGVGSAFLFNQGEPRETLVRDLSVINAYSATNGGAFTITNASPTFQRVTFANSRAAGQGGAGYVNGGSPAFLDCMFSDNTAATGGSLSFINLASPLISGVTVQRSRALSSGGGISYVGAAASVLLEDTIISGNAAERGAGLYADTQVTYTGGSIMNNVATQFGGGVAAVPNEPIGVSFIASGVTIQNNTANEGGGVFLYSCSLDMTDSTVLENSAQTLGGGISGSCSPVWRKLNGIVGACPLYINVTRGSLTGNSVSKGSGGAISSSEMYLVIEGASMSGNFAFQSGGAVYGASSEVTIHAATLSTNTASTSGGGVYCSALGRCDVTASTLSDNYATGAGGAVFYCLSSCLGTVANIFPNTAGTTFTNNAIGAKGYGPTTATDPAALTFLVGPQSSIISGAALVNTSDASLLLLIQDNYAQTVSSSINVLQLQLSTVNGQATDRVILAGPTTVLAGSGEGVFAGTSAVAMTPSDTGVTYLLTCQHTSIAAVSATATFTILPCATGQGVAAGRTGLVCEDCQPGEYSNADTNTTCVKCAAGSANPSLRASSCGLCPANTFQPTPGSVTCITCPTGSSSAEGATECIRPPDQAIGATVINGGGITGTPTVYGILAGVLAFFIALFVIIACVVYRRTRRKTMEKYYLDEDATIRRGVTESALGLAVRKLIGATTTTRIGGGEFTDVYKGRYNEQWVAVKVLKGEMVGHQIAQSEFRREVTALSILGVHKHPGIIELKFFLERSPVCIGLEFCPNGSLKRSLKGMTMNVWDKVKMAAQTASALVLLHNYNIVHMDLKTDNILLGEENTIKLADFGICKVLSQEKGQVRQDSQGGLYASNPVFESQRSQVDTNTVNGRLSSVYASVNVDEDMESTAFTPQYCDPYRLMHEDDVAPDTLKRADVFTFGMVMWAIYKGDEPFAGVDPILLTEQRRQDPSMRPPSIPDCHKCYDRVMNRAWITEPAARPTIHQCLEELRDCLRNHFGADLPPEYLNVGTQQAMSGSGSNDMDSGSSFGSLAQSANVFDNSMAVASMQSMNMPPMPAMNNALPMYSINPTLGAMGSASGFDSTSNLIPVRNFQLPAAPPPQNNNGASGGTSDGTENLRTTMGAANIDSQSSMGSFKSGPPPLPKTGPAGGEPSADLATMGFTNYASHNENDDLPMPPAELMTDTGPKKPNKPKPARMSTLN